MRRVLVGALALALVVPAWPAPTAEAQPPVISSTPLSPATLAPAFRLPRTDGHAAVSLADTAGKVRLINFWGTWCGYSRIEVPALAALQRAYRGRGLEVMGLAIERQALTPERFMQRAGTPYTSLIADAAVQKAFGGIRVVPTTFVVDRRGRLVEKIEGLRDQAYFERTVRKYL